MVQQEYFISYLMIYPLMLNTCMKSTKNVGEYKSFINQLNKMPVFQDHQLKQLKLNVTIYFHQ